MVKGSKLIFLINVAIALISCGGADTGKINYLYDLGTETSVLEKGYTRISPDILYQEKKGYGWLIKPAGSFDTLAGKWNNALNRDGIIGRDSLVFRTDIPNGDYVLTVTLGNNKGNLLNQSVFLNGQRIADSVTTPWYRIPIKSINKKITIGNGKAIIKVTAQSSIVAIQSIELRQVTKQNNLVTAGFEQDTTAVKQKATELEKQLSAEPGQTDIQNQLNAAQKYLKASYYYDLGAWSKSAKISGINFTVRMYLAADMLEQIAASENDPLYDKAVYLLGKIHYWLNSEDYDPYHETAAKQYFNILKKKYPDAALIRMYLGEKIPFAVQRKVDIKGAPLWAVNQHEAMQRMLKVIYWWVNERQEANGELGGKYGDDVEILRWWLPAILGADDATAKKGYIRLADGVWNSGILERGYAKKIDDVEHSAELFRDTHPAMFMINYGDPEYIERCLISMQNFSEVWTGITPKGHRHFKSCYLSATEVLEQPPMNVDVALNARAVLPGLWATWYNRNPTLIKLFSEWGNAWVEDAARSDHGKPAGVMPAAVTFATDDIGTNTGKWYDPGLEYAYYQWQSLGHVNEMQSQLIGMYHITKNTSFLKPLDASYNLMLEARKEKLPDNPLPGSLNWVKKILLAGGDDNSGEDNPMADVFAMAKQLTGNNSYDELISAYGKPYNKYLISNNINDINSGFKEVLNSLRYNFPLLTNEVKYTDRVYVPGSDLLFGMYTGHYGSGIKYPSVIATWKNTGPDVGVFVRGGNQKSAKVSLYNFGKERRITMQTWQLEPGVYKLTIGADTDDDGIIDADATEKTIVLKERVNQIDLQVPSRKLLVVAIEQIKSASQTRAAADLAVAARDISFKNGVVKVNVHNVGNITANNITVELWSGNKKITARKIDHIEAPNDLKPRSKAIDFNLPDGKPVKTISVRVFAKQPEITTLNNTAAYTLTR